MAASLRQFLLATKRFGYIVLCGQNYMVKYWSDGVGTTWYGWYQVV